MTKKDAFRLIQEIAIARDRYCQAPGCRRPSDCGHHIFSKKNRSTAFDPDNIIGLCTQDHTGFAHNKPEEFKKFLLGRMGEKYYGLRRKSNEVVKHLDYNEICGKLKEILLKRPQ